MSDLKRLITVCKDSVTIDELLLGGAKGEVVLYRFVPVLRRKDFHTNVMLDERENVFVELLPLECGFVLSPSAVTELVDVWFDGEDITLVRDNLSGSIPLEEVLVDMEDF